MKKLLVALSALLMLSFAVSCKPEQPETPHTHAFGEWEITTAPTCTAKGEEKRTCACGEIESREVEMIAHTFGEWMLSAMPGCTTIGEETRYCACGHKEARPVAATGVHVYGEWMVTTPASCTAKGEEKRTCACGEAETREIGLAEHTKITDAAKDATCTETGLTAGEHCSVCGHVFVAQTETPKLPHTYDDSYDATCNVCGFVRDADCKHTETIILTGKPATCTVAGLTDGAKCAKCGEILTAQSVIPATGHSFGEWMVTTPASCTAKGEEKRSCACGESEAREIDMAEHIKITDAAKDATCTEAGLTAGEHCSVCGHVFVAQTETPKLPHTYDDNYDATCNVCGFVRDADCKHTETIVLPGKLATCTEAGLTDGTKCTKCGEILTAQSVIPATGHSFGEWMLSIAPGCTTIGEEARYCDCGHKEARPVAAKGHTPGAAATCLTAQSCTVCNTELAPALGHVVVTDKAVESTCIATGLTEGSHCSACQTVLVAQVTILMRAHIYENDICIMCHQKRASEGLLYASSGIGSCIVNGIGTYTGRDIVIPAISPSGARVIGIADYAFANCSEIVSVTIPNSVTSIRDGAFYGCSGLQSITVVEGNPVYHSVGNCLIKTTSKTLILGCKNSIIPTDGSVTSIGNDAFSGCSELVSIEIPDTVTKIGLYAFYGCRSLSSVTLPEGVTVIGKFTFAYCDSLRSVCIPGSVTAIDDYAFLDCHNLKALYYQGVQADFDAVTIGNWNDAFTAVTLYFYSETAPTEAGNYWHWVDGKPEKWL